MADQNILHSPGYHHHHKNHYFSDVYVRITLVFVTVSVVLYLGLHHSGYPTLFFKGSDSFSGLEDGSARVYLSPPSRHEMTVQEINASSSSNDTELWPSPAPAQQSTTENMHHSVSFYYPS